MNNNLNELESLTKEELETKIKYYEELYEKKKRELELSLDQEVFVTPEMDKNSQEYKKILKEIIKKKIL